jgi:membrane-associated phospholipid phosphatase
VLGPLAFAGASGAFFITVGVPQQRDVLAAWLLIGMLAFSLTDVRGYVRGILRDWLPFLAVLLAYDSLRGTAKGFMGVHYLPQLRVDEWMFGGSTPTVWLQHHLWHLHVHWYDVAVWFVYLTHFFATPLLAAVLWKIDRERFRRFAVLVVALSLAGVATYALYPAAPPWMASRDGFAPHVTRIVPHVWQGLGLHSAGSVVENGYSYANDVAAVPSLHAAFSLLIAIWLWPRRRKWLRPLVAFYPLAMGFSLVYAGEHYFSDILLGWTYTVVVLLAVRAVARRLQARRARVAVAREPLPEPVFASEHAQ